MGYAVVLLSIECLQRFKAMIYEAVVNSDDGIRGKHRKIAVSCRFDSTLGDQALARRKGCGHHTKREDTLENIVRSPLRKKPADLLWCSTLDWIWNILYSDNDHEWRIVEIAKLYPKTGLKLCL